MIMVSGEARFVSPQQFARHWQVNVRSVYRNIETGEIVAYRVGGSLRIPVEELYRPYLAAGQPIPQDLAVAGRTA